jgi:tetratricopeptide (TPR) repeat protein
MKNQRLILLAATLAIAIATSPLSALTNPASGNPTSANPTSENTKTVKAAKPAAPKAEGKATGRATDKLPKKPTAGEVSFASIDADIAKEEAIKQKKFDKINAAAHADMAASNYAAAEKKYLEAVDLAESLNGNEQKLLTRTHLADCYLKQKKYKEAEKQYKEAYDSNIQLYRGNYPVLLDDAKGLSEVYKATNRPKEAEKVLASAAEARKARYSVAGVDDGDLFATFYQSMRQALAKKNTVAVSKMIQYPLAVRWNGNFKRRVTTRTYRTSQEFLADYKTIFTPKIATLFAENPEKELWCKDQGIMLGGGLAWLTNVQLVKVGGKPTYQIHAMTINDDMPKK